jgi:DNA-directed RNA polymerase subunit K/omega
MKLKTLSRGPSIDMDRCVQMAGGNRFNLVLIAAVRSRELVRKHKGAELGTQINAPVSALLDIQNGLVGEEYLRKV